MVAFASWQVDLGDINTAWVTMPLVRAQAGLSHIATVTATVTMTITILYIYSRVRGSLKLYIVYMYIFVYMNMCVYI